MNPEKSENCARTVNSKLSKSFRFPLEAAGTSLRWVIARVPIDLKKAWRMWKSRRVFGEINGFAFKTALIPGTKGQGHVLSSIRRYRRALASRQGSGHSSSSAPISARSLSICRRNCEYPQIRSRAEEMV